MWHTVEDEPKNPGSYPCWLMAEHSGYEFWHPCTFHNGRFVVEGTLREPESYGWKIMAWYDLPPFKA